MVKDAEAHAEEDKAKKDLVESKNHAESLINATEKSLKEYGDKISSAEKTSIEDAIKDLKEVMSKDDVQIIKDKTEALSGAAMKLGEAVYKAQSAAQAGATETSAEENKAKEEDVVDADFTEKK
jgi:molecular chaperone DnaK